MTFADKQNRVRLAMEIGRLIDGDVTGDEKAALERQIRAQPGGAELLDRMTVDGKRLREAASAPIPDPALERFTAAIDAGFADRQARQPWRYTRPPAVVQLAAAVVLMIGTFGLTSVWMQSRMDTTIARLAAHMETERLLLAETVQDALETRASGEPVQIGQDGAWRETLVPIKTYRSKSGHWCREYVRQTRLGAQTLTIHGTACRDQDGIWTTVLAEPVSEDFGQLTSGI